MLKGKTAIITGAASGIGLETVKLFVKHECMVIGIDVMDGEEVPDEVEFIVLDITDMQACEDVCKYIVRKHKKIDILFNCAGITRDAFTDKMTERQFHEVFRVNIDGVWNMTRCIGLHMQENKSGSIINVSSVVGLYGNMGQANYAATKAGVIGMTKSWAKEFGRKQGNVRVNAIAPGYIMTKMLESISDDLLNKFKNMTMLGRLGNPEDVANAALFLASDLSCYITGTVLRVDGGMRL